MPPAPTRIVCVPRGDMRDDDRRRRAGDARHVVMLGEPVAREAQPLGVPREIERAAERGGGVTALDDGREIENREPNHLTSVTRGSPVPSPSSLVPCPPSWSCDNDYGSSPLGP